MATTYLVYWIDSERRQGEPALKESPSFATLPEARKWAKMMTQEWRTTMATIWKFDGDQPGEFMEAYPNHVTRILGHYFDMKALAAEGLHREGT